MSAPLLIIKYTHIDILIITPKIVIVPQHAYSLGSYPKKTILEESNRDENWSKIPFAFSGTFLMQCSVNHLLYENEVLFWYFFLTCSDCMKRLHYVLVRDIFRLVLCRVPSFKASKYLITNREYLEFVNSGGYEDSKYWTKEGKNHFPQQDSLSR